MPLTCLDGLQLRALFCSAQGTQLHRILVYALSYIRYTASVFVRGFCLLEVIVLEVAPLRNPQQRRSSSRYQSAMIDITGRGRNRYVIALALNLWPLKRGYCSGLEIALTVTSANDAMPFLPTTTSPESLELGCGTCLWGRHTCCRAPAS